MDDKNLVQRPPNGRRADKRMVTLHHNTPNSTQTIGGVDYYVDKNGTRRRVAIVGDKAKGVKVKGQRAK